MHNHAGRLEKNNNAIPCFGLSAIIFLILGILPILPSQITQVFRPAEIALCFVFPVTFRYQYTSSGKCMLLFMAYYVMVLLCHPITHTSFMAWASLELFSAFFLLLIARPWSKTHIRLLMISAALASTFFSVIVFRDNPDFLHEKSYVGILFMSTSVNDNTAAFGIVPGALCSLLLLLFYSPKKHQIVNWQKIVFLGCAGLSFFTLFCIGARSAFFSALAGATLIVLEWSNSRRTFGGRTFARVAMVLLLIAIFVIGTNVTVGTHSARLFDLDNMTNGTGRDLLAEQAWNMIHKKPIFGGGFDFWVNENGDPLGTHNAFLTHMVQGGYVALLIVLGFLITTLSELRKSGSLIPLAFFVEVVAHTFTESDLNYYAYIPLIISYSLARYAYYHRCKVTDILVSETKR